jgi:hypothetical protein
MKRRDLFKSLFAIALTSLLPLHDVKESFNSHTELPSVEMQKYVEEMHFLTSQQLRVAMKECVEAMEKMRPIWGYSTET